ncbi:protein LNK1-like isoform X2 [Henckelia pumila]|uniref:protein LNK1-like isoform X2 n=1 Tax=Henckelia pumila TaxID=405737 RepID=UPI003C6E94BC
MKLEQGLWSSPPNVAFPSSSDCSSVKEVSSFPSENSRESGFKTHNTDPNGGENYEKKATIFSDESNAADTYSFSDDLGDITQTSNDIDLFENSKEKDPGYFLYDGWPEIGSFDDVDRMFRSSNSTFGLGANKEGELNWLSSADDIEGTGDMLKSDFRFPLPESYAGKYLLQNDHPTENYYVDDPSTTCAPILLRDSSWPVDKYDSSLAKRPAMAESQEELIPEEEMDEHRKQSKNQIQSDGNRKTHYDRSFNFNCLDNDHFPDQTTVNSMTYSMKFQAKNVLKPSPGESSHASSQLQFPEGFHHSYLVSAIEGNENRENLQYHQGSQQPLNRNLGNTHMTLQPSTCNTDSVGKLHFSGGEFESQCGIDSINLVIPAELGSSNVLESSTKNSCLDALSLEAASFLQLQIVMEQLDLRTKLCIRDSLYRLARRAERRHNHAKGDACGDERDASGAFMADRINNHTGSMDMETETNPIDRSIAHLLFHRPSDTYAVSANDSLSFRSPRMVHGSTTTIMVDNPFCGEENSAEIDEGSSNR